MSKAEFGSVRFFRRLITLVVVAIIAILIVALVLTSHGLKKTKADLEYYKTESGFTSVMSSMGDSQSEPFEYEGLYPDMYVKSPSEFIKVFDAERFFYLTFTGGPSERTSEILDILADKGVKATFFVYGGESDDAKKIMKRIVDEGHAIGIYGYEKPQAELYTSVESYLDDFDKEFRLVYEATGTKPDIFRFAGGTTNKYSQLIRIPLSAEMIRRGFTYYDWNATTGDNIAGANKDTVYENAINTAGEKQRIFMLLHDTREKSCVVEALPDIIDYYIDKGYEFGEITNSIRPMTFD